jgi:hypothetical protein
VVWIGDLNYRIEGLDAVVRKKVREGDFAYLFERDQVRVSPQRASHVQKCKRTAAHNTATR